MSRSRGIALAALLVLLPVGALGWVQWREWAAFEDLVAGFERDYQAETQRPAPDLQALGGLVARIRKVDGFRSDPRLSQVLARTQLLRGRVEKAWEAFEDHASALDLPAEDAVLAGRILLKLHAAGGRPERIERALGLFRSAARTEDDPETLVLAWIAALRAGREDVARQLTEQLLGDNSGDRAARLAGAWQKFSSGEAVAAAELAGLIAGWQDAPLELELLSIKVALLDEDQSLEVTLRDLESMTRKAPFLVEVRATRLGAVLKALDLDPDSPSAADHKRVVLEDVKWLLGHAPADDRRRRLWERVSALPHFR